MKITTQHFKIIENFLMIPHGDVKISNLKVLNIVIYIAAKVGTPMIYASHKSRVSCFAVLLSAKIGNTSYFSDIP